MADIFAGIGIDDQDAAIAITVGDIETIGLGIDHHVGRLVQHRRAVHAAVFIVAVGSAGRAADPHLEIAVHVELQDEAVAAGLVGGPRNFLGAGFGRGGIAGDPHIVLLVDVDAVFAVGPDAAIRGLALAGE